MHECEENNDLTEMMLVFVQVWRHKFWHDYLDEEFRVVLLISALVNMIEQLL